MKERKKITIEIQDGKMEEFLLSLIKYKTSKKPVRAILKKIVDAIHFDLIPLIDKLKDTEQRQNLLAEKLNSIYTYFFNARKDSEDYFRVSKGDLGSFLQSEFTKELKRIMEVFKITERLNDGESKFRVESNYRCLFKGVCVACTG